MSDIVSLLYSEQAERAVLGSMIDSPDCIDDVSIELRSEDFFCRPLQVLYLEILAMRDGKMGIDPGTIHMRLVDRKLSESVGSPSIMAELLGVHVSHLNVKSYVKVVKEKALLRRLYHAAQQIVESIQESPDAVHCVIDRAETAIFKVTDTTQSNSTVPASQEAEKAYQIIEQLCEKPGKLQGIHTGFSRLDELTAGWKPGEMIVVAARPGQGKTALALAFARQALAERYNETDDSYVKPGHSVGMFSLEMTNAQLMMRMLAMTGSESLQRIRQGDLDAVSRRKLRHTTDQIKSWSFFLDDTSFLTINQLRAKARRMRDRNGIELLIIDYLQLLRSESKQASSNRQNEVAEISRGTKALAKELGIPVIILAQLNRKSEESGGEPALHNLRESGAIEQDADVVMLLHRIEPEEDEDSRARGQPSANTSPILPYTLNLAKQRNGPTDKVQLLYHSIYTRFEDPLRH